MQREIKFRAWDSNDECMLYQEDVGEDFDFQVYPNHLKLLVNQQYHECGSGVAQEYWKYVEREAVFMQFTGLKDKNGVEIYEGDIVKCQPRGIKDLGIFTVRYDRVYGSYVLIFNKWCGLNVSSPENYPLGEGCFDIEVIGNIYENLDLINS